MKQILHIFAKDSRHFWPEILVSLAITAAFVRIYPNQWLSENYGLHAYAGFSIVTPALPMLASTLTVLVPVSWCILITRVVHAESLVGDRQFWLTRPYEWKGLLAAKLLFLIVYLYLPILTAQCLLLIEAGFHPQFYIPGLLFNLLLITGVLVVPLLALATVTSSFARMTLTILAVLVSIIGIAVLSSFIDSDSISNPYGDRISLPLVLCLGGTAIGLQYARRRVWLSRLLLIAVPLLITTITGFSSSPALIASAYPLSAGQSNPPAQLRYDRDTMATAQPPQDSKVVVLELPLHASGIEGDDAVIPDDVMISLDTPDGFHWSSSWQGIYGIQFLPGLDKSKLPIRISRTVYDRVRSSPAVIHLTFALTLMKAGRVTRIPLMLREFAVPDFGVCEPALSWTLSEIDGLSCRAALRQPKSTYVSVVWSNNPCSASPTTTASGVQGAAWTGTPADDPAEFGITPVWTIPVNLSNSWKSDPGRPPAEQRHLCPGTPVTFTEYNVVEREQYSLTLSDFHLPNYEQEQPYELR
jgi:hypothetical protein